ncbi:MAG TPA: hypothetical protein VKX49_28815 [Bryobacteraceae bacterium]|nr:hypothetical protein [Bryobacteraceae bacterium]
MALFNDGPISSEIDLQNYESGILGVASTEGIDLEGKMMLAQDEIASELMMFLLRRLPISDLRWNTRRARGTSDVVITAPLKQWHALKTLALVYRDSYNNQLNDRYLSKWNEYESLAKTSAETYLQIGVGLVSDPLPRPAVPLLLGVNGPGKAATYYVAVTWTNAAGDESSPSEVAVITTSDGQELAVTVVGPPANASGWNVFAGEAPSQLMLQNGSPIGFSDSWTACSIAAGRPPGPGQMPTWFCVDQKVIERG